jgi:hypothetical protein
MGEYLWCGSNSLVRKLFLGWAIARGRKQGKEPERNIPRAAMSETSLNGWKMSVINATFHCQYFAWQSVADFTDC